MEDRLNTGSCFPDEIQNPARRRYALNDLSYIMLKIKFTALFLPVIIFVLVGCKSSESAQDGDFTEHLTVGRVHQDIDILFHTISQVHPLFYNNPEKTASFREDLEKLKLDFEQPPETTQLFIRLSSILSALNDGHTELILPMAEIYHYLDSGGLFFPLDIMFKDDDIYVFRSYRDDPAIQPGTRIISINGIHANKIVSDLTELRSGANPQWRLRRMEGQSDLFKALLWMKYGWDDNFELVMNHNENQFEKEIEGVTIDLIREKRNTGSSLSPFEYRLLDESVGLLTIRTFGGDFKNYRTFISSTFEQIQREKVDHLIIDVRNNAGGQTHHAEELLSYLASGPFNMNSRVSVRASKIFKDYAKQRIPGFIRWLPVQYLDSRGRSIWRAEEGELVSIDEKKVKPKNNSKRFTGTPYLLTDEGTFSTAAVFASSFKRLDLGLVIGRTTGGEDGLFYAEPLPVRLPNSNLVLRVSAMEFVLHDDSNGETLPGVKPDIYVPKIIKDEVREIDSILEKSKLIIESRLNLNL